MPTTKSDGITPTERLKGNILQPGNKRNWRKDFAAFYPKKHEEETTATENIAVIKTK
jgi:hypothetical protein